MIETFMWGYWGWGGSTRELVKAFDAAEAERGYEPPVFVDARVRRQVRAVGFRGDAFEKMLGVDRHRWMRGLGNRAILEGGPMRLFDPSAVGELLDVVVENHRAPRRVVFFCSCQGPRVNGGRHCHRDLIGELMAKEARRRRVALSVAEWPGGAPRRLRARFPPAAARASLGDATGVPMPQGMSAAIGVSLPWGSYSLVEGSDGEVPVVLGPAIHRQGRWSLQLPWVSPAGISTERELRRFILSGRKESGCEPRFSLPSKRAPSPSWEELVVDGTRAKRTGLRAGK